MCPGRAVRIVLAEDHLPAREQAARILGEHWSVVGSASDGVELLALVGRLAPDVVVLDIAMPVMDGFEAARRLRHDGFRGALVFLSVWEDPEYVAEAFRLGAEGYVVKSRIASDLVPVVRSALEWSRPHEQQGRNPA